MNAPCGYYAAGGHCRASPATVAGRPEPAPDPALTLTGLRRSAGLADLTPAHTPEDAPYAS